MIFESRYILVELRWYQVFAMESMACTGSFFFTVSQGKRRMTLWRKALSLSRPPPLRLSDGLTKSTGQQRPIGRTSNLRGPGTFGFRRYPHLLLKYGHVFQVKQSLYLWEAAGCKLAGGWRRQGILNRLDGLACLNTASSCDSTRGRLRQRTLPPSYLAHDPLSRFFAHPTSAGTATTTMNNNGQS